MKLAILISLLAFHATAWAQTTLKVDVRMIEVQAAVYDDKGRAVTNLAAADFRIVEDGSNQQIGVFEPASSGMTIAVLVDTTGSMVVDLPHVKNAVSRLLSVLSPEHSVGMFTFASHLTQLSPFTTDRKATLSAVLRMKAGGTTALFDSLAQLARGTSSINGKKAILLLTDGDDTSSLLTLEASVRSIQHIGIPVYSMLYGRALEDPTLYERLKKISQSTGGVPFKVREPSEVSRVFERIAQDLEHIYLLGYYSSNTASSQWRAVEVSLPSRPKLKLRAKEGYWP
jgi:Ca-activated chloride channel homolog